MTFGTSVALSRTCQGERSWLGQLASHKLGLPKSGVFFKEVTSPADVPKALEYDLIV
jgi:hypothetical protein